MSTLLMWKEKKERAMLKRINLKYRSVTQNLEEILESEGAMEPLTKEEVESARKKAKYFLKYNKYSIN